MRQDVEAVVPAIRLLGDNVLSHRSCCCRSSVWSVWFNKRFVDTEYIAPMGPRCRTAWLGVLKREYTQPAGGRLSRGCLIDDVLKSPPGFDVETPSSGHSPYHLHTLTSASPANYSYRWDLQHRMTCRLVLGNRCGPTRWGITDAGSRISCRWRDDYKSHRPSFPIRRSSFHSSTTTLTQVKNFRPGW